MPLLLDEWIKLHGGRQSTEDTALVGGAGKVSGLTVAFGDAEILQYNVHSVS